MIIPYLEQMIAEDASPIALDDLAWQLSHLLWKLEEQIKGRKPTFPEVLTRVVRSCPHGDYRIAFPASQRKADLLRPGSQEQGHEPTLQETPQASSKDGEDGHAPGDVRPPTL